MVPSSRCLFTIARVSDVGLTPTNSFQGGAVTLAVDIDQVGAEGVRGARVTSYHGIPEAGEHF